MWGRLHRLPRRFLDKGQKMRVKNGEVKSDAEIRALHPSTSFAPQTYEELGWEPYVAPEPEPSVFIPHAVSMRQARLALLSIGKLADVDAAISTLHEPQQSAARIEWEYAATVERDSPLVAMLGAALELDLDALFIEAGQL